MAIKRMLFLPAENFFSVASDCSSVKNREVISQSHNLHTVNYKYNFTDRQQDFETRYALAMLAAS